MKPLIEIDLLSKRFDETLALDQINLSIEKGKVYGLIGRNGAGKTTLLKLISGMLIPTKGAIHYDSDYIKEANDICFGRDNNFYLSNYKLKALLDMAKGIFPNWDRDRAKELIDLFEIDTKKYYQKVSKGTQTMISIIISLCSGTDIILLDEPYAGLDPINRENFYSYLRDHYFDGENTVIISSHVIKEVEGYFERAIIIDKGHILIDDDMESIHDRSFELICDEVLFSEIKGTKNIIKHTKLAGQYTLSIYDTISNDEKSNYISKGARINAMDLQDLLVALCTKGGQSNGL
ncbi:MAG: ABC transporter ATP-binding protein [Vallitaleaceae bacterium]|jgi:ABC-2 type transport system ATP-binding protein|nr:ABC transporter ATP-binding protein [Vallitaleaceae bacterium]